MLRDARWQFGGDFDGIDRRHSAFSHGSVRCDPVVRQTGLLWSDTVLVRKVRFAPTVAISFCHPIDCCLPFVPTVRFNGFGHRLLEVFIFRRTLYRFLQ